MKRWGYSLLILAALFAAGCGSSSSSHAGTAPSRAYNSGLSPNTTTTGKPAKPGSESPNTVYNTCEVRLLSGSRSGDFKVESSSKYEHDDWKPSSPSNWKAGLGGGQLYGTESGFARGCWNKAKFTTGGGTIEVYVSDPYSGDNSYSCTATGNISCAGPINTNGSDRSVLYGDNLRVFYLVCPQGMRRCIGANPPWKCSVGNSCGY